MESPNILKMVKNKNKIILTKYDYKFLELFALKYKLERGSGIINLLQRCINEYKLYVPIYQESILNKPWCQTIVLVLLLLAMYAMGAAYGWT